MPWTTDDVEEHKRGLSAKKKKQWVEVANSVLRKCMADGGTEETCAASAIRQANGVVKNNEEAMIIHSIQADNYDIRTVEHQGSQHVVVPVIVMREGVHTGSHGALFHPAAELGHFIDAWNGIPITVQHPQRDGMNVSANSPDLIDGVVVGRFYNAEMYEDRVRGEAWIDVGRLQRVSPEALSSIKLKRPLDVSAGVYTDDEMNEGTWNDEEYIGIARNHRPDHVALLPGGTGACSWADGCGIRANEEKGGQENLSEELTINVLRYSGTETAAWSAPSLADFGMDSNWSDMSQADRAKVASHYLIGSASSESFGDLHFPVVGPRSGKLNERALRAVVGGRGAALQGVAAGVKSAARRRAYRLLNSEFNAELEIPNTLAVVKDFAAEGYALIQLDQSQGYREVMMALQAKLDRMDDDMKVHFLQEVYDNYLVYEVRPRSGGEASLYRRNYKVNSDSTVEFEGEPVSVRREVKYVNANERGSELMANKEEKKPCCPEKVTLLVQSENVPWQEADKEWLESLEEATVDKLIDQEKLLAQKADEQPPEETPPAQITKEQAIEVLRDVMNTPEQFFAVLPEEMRDMQIAAYSDYQAKQKAMIKEIMDNSSYTEEQLKAKSRDELQILIKMIPQKVDYSGQAGGGEPQTVDPNDVLLPPGLEVYDEKGVKVNG